MFPYIPATILKDHKVAAAEVVQKAQDLTAAISELSEGGKKRLRRRLMGAGCNLNNTQPLVIEGEIVPDVPTQD